MKKKFGFDMLTTRKNQRGIVMLAAVLILFAVLLSTTAALVFGALFINRANILSRGEVEAYAKVVAEVNDINRRMLMDDTFVSKITGICESFSSLTGSFASIAATTTACKTCVNNEPSCKDGGLVKIKSQYRSSFLSAKKIVLAEISIDAVTRKPKIIKLEKLGS